MRLVSIVACLVLLGACQPEARPEESPPRPQTAQITYVGAMFLDTSLDRYAAERSDRKRRRSLRKPLWGLYELLKGPELVRLKTETVSALYRPLAKGSRQPDQGLAEIFSLAGIDSMSLATPMVAAAEEQEVRSTDRALAAVGIAPLGLAGQTSADAIADLNVRVIDLEDAKVALVGLYLTDEEVVGNGVAALPIEERENAVAAVKKALERDGEGADLGFLLLGWHSKTDLKLRREICHAFIDRAGVDAVLSHHAGALEGIEAHGKGLVIHNPGPALLMRLDKEAVRPAVVFRIHLADGAIKWVEAQPIETHRKLAKIGMGQQNTHGTIRTLARLSRELGTEVADEHGRGIWEPGAK